MDIFLKMAFLRKVRELKMDERTFFRVAHIALFGRDTDTTQLMDEYRKTGELPKFVETYMKRILEVHDDSAI